MTIAIGDTLPEASFPTPTQEGPSEIASADLFGGKKVVLFGVPGAFTPTCHANHLPGYVEHKETLKELSVDEIAVIAVNDVHVMGAWRDATPGGDAIHFLADGSADYIQKLGLVLDATAFGMGIRAQRFSMIVDSGVVTALNVEDVPSNADASGAAALIAQLRG